MKVLIFPLLVALTGCLLSCGGREQEQESDETASTEGNEWMMPAGSEWTIPAGKEFAQEKKRFNVPRQDLNKPISEHNVYFYTAVSRDGSGKTRRFHSIITIGRPSTRYMKTDERYTEAMIESAIESSKRHPVQIYPYKALWQIRDSNDRILFQWEPRFVERVRSDPGDRYKTTLVVLPPWALASSHLILYFEDVNSDGVQDDVVFHLDLGEYDWNPPPNRFIPQ